MGEKEFVYGHIYWISRFFYETLPNPKVASTLLWLVIFLISVLVYKLGFAKKLKISQSIVIYLFLLIGCLFLTFLNIFLPILEGLIIAAMILILYKIRLRSEQKRSASAS